MRFYVGEGFAEGVLRCICGEGFEDGIGLGGANGLDRGSDRGWGAGEKCDGEVAVFRGGEDAGDSCSLMIDC